MSKEKGAHDHGHDCGGGDHKEHDHHDCSGHDHDAHEHHDCDGHDHEERVITLQGEDGKSYDCHVAGVFPFEGKEYVLLQTIPEDGEESDDEIETIIMEMIEENEMATFRSIESDEEFERVMDFVMKVAKEADEAYARGES